MAHEQENKADETIPKTPQSLEQTTHHEATNTVIIGPDITPMRSQTPQLLGPTPYHAATNADKKNQTTTEASSKKTRQFDIHLSLEVG